MYVLEGMGAVLPMTNEAATAVARNRVVAINAQAAQSRGFGNYYLGPDTYRQSLRTAVERGWFQNTFGQQAGDFIETWGLPIGAGLGALALGLVIAKRSAKK